jgi:hypothetical protein
VIALVVLLFVTDMHYPSFITGLIVGMLIIQFFFHRLSEPLPLDRAPEIPTPRESSCPTQSKKRRVWHGARLSS